MPIFSIKTEEHKDLEDFFNKTIEELKVFFDIYPKGRRPSLTLVSDRKTINALRGGQTEPWVVGWFGGENVYVLCPENYEAESDHKYSDEEYRALIKHELCHMFVLKICETNRNAGPLWIWEGTAIYVSGQNRLKKPLSEFHAFIEQKDYIADAKSLYYESGFAVGLLIEKFGKEKFLTMLKNLKNLKSEEEFNAYFKELYGFELMLENFNNLLENRS